MMTPQSNWLNRVPLKRKLVVMMMLVMTAAFGIAGIINGMYDYFSDRREMEQQAGS